MKSIWLRIQTQQMLKFARCSGLKNKYKTDKEYSGEPGYS